MAAIHKWLLRYIGVASSKTSRLKEKIEGPKRQKQLLKEMQKPVQQYLRGYGRISTARNLIEEAGEVAGLELDIIRERRRPL